MITSSQYNMLKKILDNPGESKFYYYKYYQTRNGHLSARYGYQVLRRCISNGWIGDITVKLGGYPSSLYLTPKGFKVMTEYEYENHLLPNVCYPIV